MYYSEWLVHVDGAGNTLKENPRFLEAGAMKIY
jgi:hypothetical protein